MDDFFINSSGTDVMIFSIFSPINSAKKMAFLTQNKAKLCKNWIITLVFEKNANFFAENCQKSQKIVIITSTPGWTSRRPPCCAAPPCVPAATSGVGCETTSCRKPSLPVNPKLGAKLHGRFFASIFKITTIVLGSRGRCYDHNFCDF
jgi:hypothetical protein